MSRFKEKYAEISNKVTKDDIIKHQDYGLSDLNWKDDGDILHDPSINDYNKGWQMEPYEMRYYAKNKLYQVKEGDSLASIAVYADTTIDELYKLNGFSKELIPDNKKLKANSYIIVGKEEREKTAAEEIRDITYTPENLAKEILTLWSQVDGPLQNFFEAFTMNKMNNKMKQEIADILKSWGYDVTPVYTQDTPIYAKSLKTLKKIAESKDVKKILEYFIKVFPESYAAQLLYKEIKDLVEDEKVKVTTAQASGLLDYYKMIYPEDYALSLLDKTLNTPEATFEEFKDIQISDESLSQIEKMDTGTQEPMSKTPNNGGVGGYDFTTHMRPDGPGGVAPTNYEVTTLKMSNLKKKK